MTRRDNTRARFHVEASRARLLARGYVVTTIKELMERARQSLFPREKMQVPRRQTGFTYSQGPMYYLGQQIVKAMQDCGRPAKILYCYRSPEKQAELYAKGRTAPGKIVTKAPPWYSAHQYSEAVDIIHPERGWAVSDEYWEELAACVRIVAEKYGVNLVHGHKWRFRDSAHIELYDWRVQAARFREQVHEGGETRPPNAAELWQRFRDVLPDIAKRIERDGRKPVTD